MKLVHYMHILWVFILGLALVVVGLVIMLMFDFNMAGAFPDIGYSWESLSFGVMVIGLGIGGVGAIRGKRKLRNSLYTSSPWFQKKEEPQAYREVGPQMVSQQATQPYQQRPQPQQTQQPQQKPQPVQQKLSGPMEQQPAQEEPESQYSLQDINKEISRRGGTEEEMVEEMEGVEHEIVPEDVVRILVCPKCGFDNPEENVFCSKCGKKLKTVRAAAKKKPASKKQKKKAKPKKKAKKKSPKKVKK